MRILFVVTSANDVFVYNLAKWIRASLDCTLDAYELNPSSTTNQMDSTGLFNLVETASWNSWWGKNKVTRFVLSSTMIARQLDAFVGDKYYDVIHVHGVWDYIPLTKSLKTRTDKLYVSFWGSELMISKICFSHKLYYAKTQRFIDTVDGITGARERLRMLHEHFPQAHMYETRLGIASLDNIIRLVKCEPKGDSKQFWQIPNEKVSLLIGYSGKRLHNHIYIINELKKHPELSDKIHLLAPMTRGSAPDYIKEVERSLNQSGFSYTLIKDRFLSDEEVAHLRRATDIVFQFADRDAYSRSIIESLCAGALLIYGNWIKYQNLLNDDGFEAVESESVDNGVAIINDFIEQPNKYESLIERNLSVGYQKYLWSECIKGFVDLYTGKKDAEVF